MTLKCGKSKTIAGRNRVYHWWHFYIIKEYNFFLVTSCMRLSSNWSFVRTNQNVCIILHTPIYVFSSLKGVPLKLLSLLRERWARWIFQWPCITLGGTFMGIWKLSRLRHVHYQVGLRSVLWFHRETVFSFSSKPAETGTTAVRFGFW